MHVALEPRAHLTMGDRRKRGQGEIPTLVRTKGGTGMQNRIYQGDDGQWYYRVRGNHSIGPFDASTDAERALNQQLRSWVKRGPLNALQRTWHPARLLRRSATRQS